MLVNLYIFYYSVLKFKLQFLTVEIWFAFMNVPSLPIYLEHSQNVVSVVMFMVFARLFANIASFLENHICLYEKISIHFNFNFQHFYIFTIYILFLLFLTQERKDQAWVSRGGEDEG